LFEEETIKYMKKVMEMDTKPELVYLPTEQVMQRLILRQIFYS
jgi:hypothetical protein